MGLEENIRFFAATDVGRVRDHNEDNYLVDKKLGLFVVADGMGGHAAGEVASALAVRTVHDEVKKEKQLIDDYQAGTKGAAKVTDRDILNLLEFAVQRACARIHEEALSDKQKRGMGTTLSSLLVVGNKGFIGHVGDSRIYMMRGGRVQQLTEDHTVFNELIKRGKLTRDQIEKVAHKNAITRAVGVYERVEIDTLLIELLPGDQFLLASDGLHGYVNDPVDLTPYLAEADGEAAVQQLIAFANEAGGKDNITSIVVRLGEGTQADNDRAKKLALKREVLAKMPLFSRLSEREMLRVMQVAEVRAYEPGQLVIQEGDRGDELFTVLSGKVTVSRGDTTLTSFGSGEHFGEMALIRSVPRSATVHAEGACELIAIRRGDFFEILRKEHELAVKLLWQFLGVLADRLDRTSKDLRVARAELTAEDVTAEIFPVSMDDEDEPTDPYGASRRAAGGGSSGSAQP
ncbi:MAG TPA: Stp1/IreP family PP2C-type Ser/Thr phosphatase [Polyangiaceae bacterium]|nr:Stp1/IreP family PP2C-type Ser/Thr phosphatase [Polyangiaceae bacterium]